MKLSIDFSADIIADSGLENIVSIALDIRRLYVAKDYGINENSLFFVICCVGENTKMRKRYVSKEKTLYWDVILSYKQMKNSDIKEKKRYWLFQ